MTQPSTSKTPRTDKEYFLCIVSSRGQCEVVKADFALQLESKLAAANERIKELNLCTINKGTAQKREEQLQTTLAELMKVALGMELYCKNVLEAYQFEQNLQEDSSVNHQEIYEAEQALTAFNHFKQKHPEIK